MRESRFTEEQIIAILNEQERGMATAEICRKHGVSPASFYIQMEGEVRRHGCVRRAQAEDIGDRERPAEATSG